MSHLCDSTVAGPAVWRERENALATRCEKPLFRRFLLHLPLRAPSSGLFFATDLAIGVGLASI